MFMSLCSSPFLAAQTRKPTQAGEIRHAEMSPLEIFQRTVKDRSVLAQTEVERCGDSLAATIADSSASAKRGFTLFSDSVVAATADSMNALRRASLDSLKERVALAAVAVADQHVAAVRALARETRQVILASANRAAACADCGPGDDYGRRGNGFLELCDSLKDTGIDALTTRADQALDAISQRYDYARDSVSERAESLLDKEREEREARADSIALEEEIASRLIITLGYDNPVAYLGRDNGVHFYGVSPSVLYNHRSGLFASVSGSWLDKTKNSWDVSTASVGFKHSIGDAWSGSLSYTHLWFSSTSSQSKSVLDNSLDLDVEWSGALVTTTAEISFAFSKTSETSLLLTAVAPLTVYEGAGRGTLAFEPGITGAYGQQDASLVTARKQKSNKNGVPVANVKPRKTIGVLEYELSLPLSYHLGAYAFSAGYTIVLPLNILDESTSSLFGVLSIEISMTIR